MKFAVYGENVTITDRMREQIENRLSALNKYIVIDEQQSAKVTVKDNGGALKVEVNVPTKVGLMRSEVVHEEFSTAVDLAIDKLEDQIRRQKGRLSRRHKDSLAENFVAEEQDIIWTIISHMRFEEAITFVGEKALSVDVKINLSVPYLSAA